MILSELYRRLALGELSNLAMASGNTIREKDREKIVMHANEGLRRLHTRFVLREKSAIVKVDRGITTYKLSPEFAVSRQDISGNEAPYILDSSEDPFEDDVIRILKVVDNYGHELPLDVDDNPRSIHRNGRNEIQLPFPMADMALGIVYQAMHDPLSIDGDNTEIDIPHIAESALRAFIAGEVYSQMNGAENSAKGQEYSAKFELICVEAEEKDLLSSSHTQEIDKFERNGWT